MKRFTGLSLRPSLLLCTSRQAPVALPQLPTRLSTSPPTFHLQMSRNISPDESELRLVRPATSTSKSTSPNPPSKTRSPPITAATSKRSRESSTVIEISDSDDDKPAVKRSRAVLVKEKTEKAQQRRDESESQSRQLPLNRAAMEKERLARRLAAEKAQSGDQSELEPSKHKVEQDRMVRARVAEAKAMLPPVTASEPESFYSNGEWSAPSRTLGTSAPGLQRTSEPKELEKPKLKFAEPAVLKTWSGTSDGVAMNEIKIEDVLEKGTLQIAVLSAFQFDFEWIMQRLPLNRLRSSFSLHLVMQGKDPSDRAQKEQMLSGLPGITLVFPPMEGQVNCMHSKLMLLFQKRGNDEWLRIVVPTANLTDYDWGYCGGIMENMVFIVDLPKMKDVQPEQTFFMKELLNFCAAKKIEEEVLTRIVGYDFAKTGGLAFVHSIGGSHLGEDVKRTGYPGLGEAVKTLGLRSGKGLELDYVTSSLGAAKDLFIADIYRAAQGYNGISELERRQKKPTKAKPGIAQAAITISDDDAETETDVITRKFRIYFPSEVTVEESTGGKPAAGTVCFQRKWWNDPSFPKDLVMDCKSVRKGMLMHNKLLYARPKQELSGKAGKVAAWVYVGSANLSESAWGKLVMDRSSKAPKLNLRNWECGVIIPIPSHQASDGRSLGAGTQSITYPISMSKIEKLVPVPMEHPGEPMNQKIPWFFMDEYVN